MAIINQYLNEYGDDGEDAVRLWMPDLARLHAKTCPLEIDFIRRALPTESPRKRLMQLAEFNRMKADEYYKLAKGPGGDNTWNGF